MVHGDDWKYGIQKNIRKKVINTLKKWSGKLIEPTYTKNISSTIIRKNITQSIPTTQNRISNLRRLMDNKNIVRVLESHSSLTGLMIETTPKIKSMFAILDPIILPRAISILLVTLIACNVAANSGRLVPRATTVKPIK